MTRRERLRLQFNVIRFDLKERIFDLGNIAFPVFLGTGLVVGAVKFWLWVLP